ncbi:beta-scruin-like [Stegodyphus dumicola]|uniref:beta-scruin-like n=1 Tax=Stegodyphus dumicola TaxID=202533 RepID=UPI0015ABB9FD|nr:beta-scruin-like [Stegodyphus dumicola]
MLDSVEVYDPESNSWEELSEGLNTPTMGVGASSYKGKLWVCGGMVQDMNGKICVVKEVQCYDPKIKEWSYGVKQLPCPRSFATAVRCKNLLFLVGGTSYKNAEWDSEEMKSLCDVICYDDARRTWCSSTPLPYPRHFVGAAVIGKTFYVLGGLTSFQRDFIDDVIVHDESNGTWHECAPLPIPLCGFSATSVPNVI